MNCRKYSFFLSLALATFTVGCGESAPEASHAAPAAREEAHEDDHDDGHEDGVVSLSEQALARVDLEIVEALREEVSSTIEVNGRVALDEDLTMRVSSFVEGIVRECCKSVGSYVKAGESLAVLHSHQTHELLAAFRTAQAELEARRGELDYARQARDRASRLHELKAGPLADVQRADAALTRAERAVTAAEAELTGKRAHFEYLGVEAPREGEPVPDHLEVRVSSPRAGTVVERSVTPGGVVAPTQPLYVVSDLSRVWVMAHVPEQQLAAVRPGMKVGVRVRAYPDRTFPGVVSVVSSQLDPETSLAAVRCVVPNPGAALKAGMYAQVELHSREMTEVVTVPVEAVQRIDDRPTVFVAEGAGRFEMRRITTGSQYGGRIAVTGGLDAGARVVAKGSFVLKAESMSGEMSGHGDH